jgi:hypothetical protein
MTRRAQPLTSEAQRSLLSPRHPNLARHARKCSICNHAQREAIEDDFFRWDDPLYRHAEATGLLARRRRNLRGVAERVLENVDDAKISGNTILRAMRIFAHVTEDGQWIEPPKESLVTHIHKFEQPAPPSPISNNSQRGCATRALEGSIENKSLTASPEQILIGNESVSRGEPSD